MRPATARQWAQAPPARRVTGSGGSPWPSSWRRTPTSSSCPQRGGTAVAPAPATPATPGHIWTPCYMWSSLLNGLFSLTRLGYRGFEESCPQSWPQEEGHTQPLARSVGEWLKHHRLHKYTNVLTSISHQVRGTVSYVMLGLAQELMELTEEKLISMGITKGASRKISKCVQKLHERPETLTEICESLDKGSGDIQSLLSEMEDVVRSPILVEKESGGDCSGRDLINQIVVTLTKLCSSLLLSPTTDRKTGNTHSGE